MSLLSGIATNPEAYVLFSLILFSFGIVAALARKNAIGIFMGVELMLNAAALNFVTFQVLRRGVVANETWLHGHIFSLFVIILAAIESPSTNLFLCSYTLLIKSLVIPT